MLRTKSARPRPGASPALVAALVCGTLGGGLLGAGLLGFDRVAAEAASTAPGTAAAAPRGGVPGAALARAEVIERAGSWVAQGVPYSQTRWWTDTNGTYRQDCSGMVAMAWHLSTRTNYWTGNLATVSYRVPSSSLKPGDILLLPRNHVVIFAGWADDSHTRFNLYEQYRRGHPARYVLDASLAYYLDRGFGAYRYQSILDLPLDLPVLTDRDGTGKDTIARMAATRPVTGVRWTEQDAGAWEPQAKAPATQDAVSSGGSELMAGGIALLLLSFPLGVAVRAGAWSPAGVGRRASST